MSPLLTEGTENATRIVQSDSPLTRLHYFDGKFLRADDLAREQQYLRQLVQLSNQGLGAGIVYGFDTTLGTNGRLALGSGLAYDGEGRTLLLPSAASVSIASLFDQRIAMQKARSTSGRAAFGDCVDVPTDPTGGVVQGTGLYVICLAHAESLCGTEDV